MGKAKSNGNGRLEAAVAALIEHQATFVAQLSVTDRRLNEMERINTERFARIEVILMEHSRILADHTRILGELARQVEALRDAIRDKIGFKSTEIRQDGVL